MRKHRDRRSRATTRVGGILTVCVCARVCARGWKRQKIKRTMASLLLFIQCHDDDGVANAEISDRVTTTGHAMCNPSAFRHVQLITVVTDGRTGGHVNIKQIIRANRFRR